MTSTESCGGKPRQIVRIGLIATLTGPGGTIGTGIRNSLEAALDRAEERITNCAIDLQLFVQNDCSDPLEAIRCAEKCMNAGCLVVIGPNDSASMSAVIKDKRFAKLPKFSTLATATDLSKQSCRSFFRFTTPNDARVEKLVLKMIELHPQRRCYLFSLVASHES